MVTGYHDTWARLFFLTIICFASDAGLARSEENSEGQAELAASESYWGRGGDDWSFRAIPYFWLPVSVDGNSTVDGAKVDVDLELDDVVELLDFGIAGRAEAWKGKVGFVVDSWYVSLGMDAEGDPGPNVDVDIRQAQADFMLGYQVGNWSLPPDSPGTPEEMEQNLILDTFGGVRYVYLEQDIDFSRAPDRGGDRTWVEPVIGARLILETESKVSFIARGDLSGFGVPEGSDLTWTVQGGVGYQPWERSSIGLGYRAYGIDYSDGHGDDKFGFDAVLHGPYLTFAYQF